MDGQGQGYDIWYYVLQIRSLRAGGDLFSDDSWAFLLLRAATALTGDAVLAVEWVVTAAAVGTAVALACAGLRLGGLGGAGGGDEASAEGSGPTDSRADAWGKPQQTEINGIALRILIQDEDSKYNVLTMLTEDDDEAEAALERVVRILDLCREGTSVDIDEAQARDMAEAMREFMLDRADQELPKPSLLTDREDLPERGLPTTLREFLVLPSFTDHHFRDFRDHEGVIVHSIGSFLTISTSVSTYQDFLDAMEEEGSGNAVAEDVGATQSPGTGGTGAAANDDPGNATRSTDAGSDGGILGDPLTQGAGEASNGTAGIAVNVNTAPNAVLHGISDRRDIDWTFLDEILEYRNEEEEDAEGEEDAEPVYDEFGEEVVQHQIFDSVDELADVDGWDNLEPEARDDFLRFMTVQSHVFTIFVTARKAVTEDSEISGFGMSVAERRELEERGTDLVRTVKCVVWRHQQDDEWVVVPLERWEVLDYQPFEVLDFPDDER